MGKYHPECHSLVAEGRSLDITCSMVRCEFCTQPANGLYPATRLVGNPQMERSWECGLVPMCGRCWRKTLMDASSVGKKRRGAMSDGGWVTMSGRRLRGSNLPPGSSCSYLDGRSSLP